MFSTSIKKQLLQTFLIFLSIASSTASQATAWILQDISILFPLPRTVEKMNTLMPASLFLPQSLYLKHSVSVVAYPGDTTYRDLRVVGIRIDPEQNQIRMVMQPVVWDKTANRITTEDRATHTFHQLRPATFSSFLSEWKNLMAKSPRTTLQPLTIHPGFAATPSFGTDLIRLITRYCNSNNLIQYTVMRLMTPGIWWQFAGIKRDTQQGAETWTPFTVPRMKGVTEDFFNESTQKDAKTGQVVGMRGQLNFAFDNDVELTKIVTGYSDPTEHYRPEFQRSLHATTKLQNPHLTHASQTDCVSCHIAQPVQFWMKATYPGLQLPQPQIFDQFINPDPASFNLSNVTVAAKSTVILRALGYMGHEPALNQRLIHESALSAHYLNTQGK